MKLSAYSMLILLLLGCSSCHNHDHDHHHGDGHDHDHGDGHGHDHDNSSPRFEWWGFTESHEVFIDANVPIHSQSGAFHIHFTDLKDFKPESGVSVRFEWTDAAGTTRLKAQSTGEGIWTVEHVPMELGQVTMGLWWATVDADGYLDLGTLNIGAEGTTWTDWAQPEDAVSFGREQVWSMPFATDLVATDTVHQAMRLAGKWMAAPGDDRILAAGASGLLLWAEGIAVAGAAIAKGQILAYVQSDDLADRSLASEAIAAEAEWNAASAAAQRLKPLYDLGVVPAGEWESAEMRLAVAQEAWERLKGMRDQNAWVVRSPIAGYIRSVQAPTGGYVHMDTPIAALTTDREQWLEVQLNPAHRSRIETCSSIRVLTEMGWVGGHLASMANQIADGTGLLSAYVALDEVVPGSRPIAGSFAEVEVAFGKGQPVLAVPSASLLETYGQFEVAVQVSGEQFEMRPVAIGLRNADRAEVIAGLSEGERVASVGAYAVRMASMKGSTPAHGHTH